MGNLVKFTLIALALAAAVLSTLAVGGVLSSDELWSNAAKIAELVGIMFVFSAIVLVVAKK